MIKYFPASEDCCDETDRAILRALELDGRMPVSTLARQVGIAESTCHKRIQALVKAGIILGFHADLNLSALGVDIEALIFIRVNPYARDDLRKLQDFLKELKPVRQVYFMAGDKDFILHVAVQNTSELRELITENISTRKEISGTSTHLIFDHLTQSPGLKILPSESSPRSQDRRKT